MSRAISLNSHLPTHAPLAQFDTIYGPGPDEAPHAYEPTDNDGTRPRTPAIGPPPPTRPHRGGA